jgi:cystathionine beta-lyase
MRSHEQSAMRVAQWLEQRQGIARVIHPALASHPQHALFKRDFKGASGLFGFVLDRAYWGLAETANGPEDPQAARLLAALCEGRRHFGMGYSWGGFESLIMPGRLSALRSAKPWQEGPLLRVHIGLEDPQDLIDDLEAGFQAMAKLS